jgi:hypothetical protein
MVTLRKHRVASFVSEIATALAKFDWRTSATPGLPEELRREPSELDVLCQEEWCLPWSDRAIVPSLEILRLSVRNRFTHSGEPDTFCRSAPSHPWDDRQIGASMSVGEAEQLLDLIYEATASSSSRVGLEYQGQWARMNLYWT